MEKNYYEILGVKQDATELEIIGAYRTIKSDRIPKEVQEAYDILIFERDKYDKKLSSKKEVKSESKNKNYYELLGVKQDATIEEIMNAYRNIDDKTDEVKIAYETLVLSKKRKEYDEKLSRGDKSEKNYYEILGVKQDATIEEIMAAYRSIPNKSFSLQIAYETLLVPSRRKEYDEKLSNVDEIEKTAYEILGVRQDATIEEIMAAYDNIVVTTMSEIVEAYETLKDSTKRKEYDEKLLKEKEPKTPEKEESSKETVAEELSNTSSPEELSNTSEKEKTAYEILGVEPDATLEELKSAFDKIENKTPEVIDAFTKAVVEVSEKPKKEVIDENFEDLFSNSKDQLVSFGKKSLPVLKKIGKVGLEGLLVSTSAVWAGLGYAKFKLTNFDEDEKEKQITNVKTEESRLEAKYRENLLYDIEKRLSKPHFDSKLEIAKIRYENQIELLKRKIYMKENQKVKKGMFVIYKLELMALKKQLIIYEEKLKEVEQQLKDTKEKSEIPRLQEELVKVTEQIEALEKEPEKKTLTIQKLKIEQQKLVKKIKRKIDREKSRSFNKGIFEQKYINTRVNIENVKNIFVSSEELDEKSKTVR